MTTIFNLFSILFSGLGTFGLLTFIALIVVLITIGSLTIYPIYYMANEFDQDTLLKSIYDFHLNI